MQQCCHIRIIVMSEQKCQTGTIDIIKKMPNKYPTPIKHTNITKCNEMYYLYFFNQLRTSVPEEIFSCVS